MSLWFFTQACIEFCYKSLLQFVNVMHRTCLHQDSLVCLTMYPSLENQLRSCVKDGVWSSLLITPDLVSCRGLTQCINKHMDNVAAQSKQAKSHAVLVDCQLWTFCTLFNYWKNSRMYWFQFFFCGATAQIGPSCLVVEVSRSQTIRHTHTR
jgi:hypothetical protein